jgi:DNA replication and repair protein RecF
VWVEELWMQGVRRHVDLHLNFHERVTAIVGPNAQGKTTVLEALAWLTTGGSIRPVPDRSLIQTGANEAIIRARFDDAGREVLIEGRIAAGRSRVEVNRQVVTRRSELMSLVRLTPFTPDDLQLIKAGPSGRREFIDHLTASIAPGVAAAQRESDRILRHRNALLKSMSRGEASADDLNTLSVWNEQFAAASARVVGARLRLTEMLTRSAEDLYAAIADQPAALGARYESEWLDRSGADPIDQQLLTALRESERDEVRRGVTLVGPHRDDWLLTINRLDARTCGSQGEQRSLALALRLAGHRVVTELTGTTPIVLLDDVFSELDDTRRDALVRNLPEGQVIITSAAPLPSDLPVDRTIHLDQTLRTVSEEVFVPVSDDGETPPATEPSA